MPLDALAFAGTIVRGVQSVTRDGKPAKAVIATATYDTSLEDLWDAVTTASRIRRWFLPVTGELKLGGHYQLEGNAGGTITACDPPHAFAATWEMGGQTSWLDVTLKPAGKDKALLELRHTAIVDENFWPTYGPGAVGVGWDLGLFGLYRHISDPTAERPPEAALEWQTSDEAKEVYRLSSAAWGEAAAADGMVNAKEAAENTRKFYSGETAPGM
ncbi:MAG TPA: SRPBCC family protein [Devosia sp.]|nr:SRPBCC family protein [Devosia sp.]